MKVRMTSPRIFLNENIGFNLAIFLFVLNLIDGLFTLYWTKLGGYHIEMNPLMFFLMKKIGDWWLIPKILMGLIVAILVTLYWRRFRSARIVTMIVLGIYMAITIYHLILLVAGS